MTKKLLKEVYGKVRRIKRTNETSFPFCSAYGTLEEIYGEWIVDKCIEMAFNDDATVFSGWDNYTRYSKFTGVYPF